MRPVSIASYFSAIHGEITAIGLFLLRYFFMYMALQAIGLCIGERFCKSLG